MRKNVHENNNPRLKGKALLIFGLLCFSFFLFGCTQKEIVVVNPTQSYGGMWGKSDSGFVVVDLVTPDVYVPITDLNSNYLQNFVFSDSNLVPSFDGVYLASITTSMDSANNGAYGMKLFVDDVGQNNCYAHRDFKVGDTGSFGFNCFVDLNAGQIVNVRLDDHANPVGDATIYSFNITLSKIN